jgi:hypothetical protein
MADFVREAVGKVVFDMGAFGRVRIRCGILRLCPADNVSPPDEVHPDDSPPCRRKSGRHFISHRQRDFISRFG